MSASVQLVAATARPTLERLIRHARTLLAPHAVVYAERSGSQIATWTAHSDLEAVVPHLASMLIVRDRPLLLPRVAAWQGSLRLRELLASEFGTERGDHLWQLAGRCSLLVVPVHGSIGNRLGVLVALRLDETSFSPTDLRNAQVLADISALALERAELLELESRRARRELLLKRASEEIAATLDPDQVLDRLAHQAREVAGADAALVLRLEPGMRSAQIAAASGLRVERDSRAPIDPGLLARVARSRQPWVGPAEGRLTLGSAMFAALALAPLATGSRVRAILCVLARNESELDRDRLDALVELARFADVAIANAVEHDRERRIARALTLGFVPEPLPSVPDYEFGLVYEPAADAVTGGDIYGVWELASGATALLVGDAAGKGVERAALSAMVRFFVEARSSDASDPLDALAEANRLLCRRLPEDTFATAFFAVLERDRLRWALAGHLPPLVVANGAVRELEAGGMPLGVAEDLITRRGELELTPGATLVAYTDGVTEARRDGELFGRSRLVKLLNGTSPQSHPQAIAEQVRDAVRAFAGRAQDDLLVLALRRADGATDAAIESRPR